MRLETPKLKLEVDLVGLLAIVMTAVVLITYRRVLIARRSPATEHPAASEATAQPTSTSPADRS